MDPKTFTILLIIGVLLGVGLRIWDTVRCKRIYTVIVSGPIEQVRAATAKKFSGTFWTPCDGTGEMNWRRNTSDKSCVVSVDFDALPDGNVEVNTGLDAYVTQTGIVQSKGRSKPRKLAKALEKQFPVAAGAPPFDSSL
ncbi:hypothetical protein SAMN06309944_2421 [Micrococcales bacterium KH10]|nr:hypothetical protein SAMN06309944_2421 [Micrococcales bacterium KH10]